MSANTVKVHVLATYIDDKEGYVHKGDSYETSAATAAELKANKLVYLDGEEPSEGAAGEDGEKAAPRTGNKRRQAPDNKAAGT